MVEGYNKAKLTERLEWRKMANQDSTIKNRPCIFLSHIREDKLACREIAKYLQKAQIDYYLDEEDIALQSAFHENDAIKITESIKKGIRNSTHMLCIISGKTYKSDWVPFEVGYAAIIDKDIIENFKKEKI